VIPAGGSLNPIGVTILYEQDLVRLPCLIRRALLCALLGVIPLLAAAAPANTSDIQEQRHRAQQQEQERQRLQQAPNVNLQNKVLIDNDTLPIETPCFKIDNIVLDIPEGLNSAVAEAGKHALSLESVAGYGSLTFAPRYLKKYHGQCVGREGMNLIVHRVTALIIKNGYSTTRVGIPEQDMSQGVLHLSLIPGIISSIRFAEPNIRGTWRNAFPTGAGKLLNLRDLEQGLEQMKRVSSQDVDMQIMPGMNLGESDVVLRVKRIKPWKATSNLDDSGLKSTGQYQVGLNLALDNLLGLSDIFNMGYTHDADGNPGQYGTRGRSFYYSIPYGYFTFTTTGSKYFYHEQVAGNVSAFVSSGDSSNIDLKVEYLFYRDQSEKDSLAYRTGKYFSESFLNGTPIDVQRRDNSFAEVGYIRKQYIGSAQLNGSLTYRWGEPWYGAERDSPGALSGGPTYYYGLEVLDLTFASPVKMLGLGMRYTGTLHAQTSPDTLFPTEDIAIGSRYTVRGFDGNTTLSSGERLLSQKRPGDSCGPKRAIVLFRAGCGRGVRPQYGEFARNAHRGCCDGIPWRTVQ
jgi:hemolysin activation/secretion protein